jgi:hypothetical protein
MAKVLNPLNSTEARGRVGGLVYNTWRGIRTVKTHTQPQHQDDPKRQAHKLIVQEAGIRWSSITTEQRTAWDHFASLHPNIDWTGAKIRLAGYHWYVRIQTTLIDTGNLYIDDPPTELHSWFPSDLTAASPAGDIVIEWTGSGLPLADRHYLDVWWTKPLSAGRHPSIHEATRHGYCSGEDNTYIIQSAPTGYYTLFLRTICVSGLRGTWHRFPVYVPPN